MEPVELGAGTLLIASAALTDPNFARSLVLLIDTGSDGAVGVVLNRPIDLPVRDVLEPWADLASAPGVLFRGGPVEEQTALAVARLDPAADDQEPMGFRRFAGDLGLVDLDTPVELLADTLTGLRVFAGYAGWSAGQLEGELAEGAWHVVPAAPEDVFTADAERLWGVVLRRQGGALAMLATQPEDPLLN